ncbi:hypothetical protein B9J07_28225 [Sinorhizobium sp. LM21]|uniref:ribbon-helix-helix domain-containing protein n=1 Tax=Sinorhizobium sp. LM21 TaxID=1449788 RepID=UPI000B5B551D|nr:ribbon-helix-helix domain-containing protein [Sinorhizobium sp. LM21]OWZ90475.1 hypothetical protein B9J07_28225 [Sinorhizobium sp. LM21]
MGIQSTISPAAKYRDKKESQGEKQVLVWMKAPLTERIDAMIKSGEFRNRSEAVEAAVNEFTEGKQRA